MKRKKITHLDSRGRASMVDVGEKPATHRVARAHARVLVGPSTMKIVRENKVPKGDIFAAARLAGIMAAKRTPELIPLCHGISLSSCAIEFTTQRDAIVVESVAKARDKTGVEMEAMVAASVAALTLYDMLKSIDKGIVVSEVMLLSKSGGKSGDYQREPRRPMTR